VQHNITGRFLLETPTEQLEDMMRHRCKDLEKVQKKRVMYEIDRLRQTVVSSPKESDDEDENDEAPSEDASSLSGDLSTPAPKGLLSRFFGDRSLDGPRVEDMAALSMRPPTPDADEWDSSDDECASEKSFEDERTGERWRTSGSRFIGRHVSVLVWDERGVSRNRRQGIVVSYCGAVDDACGHAKLWRARIEDCDDAVELDEAEVRACSDAWDELIQWRRGERFPRQRDTASVRREQAAARREQGLADDPEADAAAQVAVRAAQLQLSMPLTAAERKRGRPPKALVVRPLAPASPKGRRKATISAAAAAQMLPPTTTRSRASSSCDLGSPKRRGSVHHPQDPSPEAAAARREERKRRRAEADVEAARRSKLLSQQKRAEVDRTMAGLDVVTLSSPDALLNLRAQGLTRRDRRRQAAREQRTALALPPPPALATSPRARPRRELAGRRSCAGCNAAPCTRNAAGCFKGVGQANGKYVVRGLDHERYATAELAARRRDMLLSAGECRSFDEPPNFERHDPEQLKFERDHATRERAASRKRARGDDQGDQARRPKAPSVRSVPSPRAADDDAPRGPLSPRPRRGEHVTPPPGNHNVGTLVRHDARSWWISDDDETISSIAEAQGLDPEKVLAANLGCTTFSRGPRPQLHSPLRHHTAVLLPGC